jgi:hypothetical protein
MPASCSIYLGRENRLALLYSYPNAPNGSWSLATTILHWFNLTLQRDGIAALGARASVRVEGPDDSPSYFLDLDGPPAAAASFHEYGKRLPQFLENGWDALNTVVPRIKADGKWDPDPDPEPPPYRPWRFFLPHGMAMVNQRSLQFFHYPPIRLLETFQDYLYDPVPFRWNELLAANGVTHAADLPLYSTVVDATPIAAEDDQGSKTSTKGDPEWGLIPIQYFANYQKAQVELLLNPAANSDYYTIPMVVYGGHPKSIFNQLYNVKLGVNVATTADIIPGEKTAVLGANHPYLFYWAAQSQGTNVDVGSGQILPQNCANAVKLMTQDLIVARWQKVMSDDPSQDPQAVLADATRHWSDPARAAEICALVQHEGSLLYPDPRSLDFHFRLTMAQASDFCKAGNNDPCAVKSA